MIQRYTRFWIFRKGSRTGFFTTFCVWFPRINFLILYPINWLNFIVWLSLLLEILGNMWIVITCHQIVKQIEIIFGNGHSAFPLFHDLQKTKNFISKNNHFTSDISRTLQLNIPWRIFNLYVKRFFEKSVKERQAFIELFRALTNKHSFFRNAS